MNPGRPAPASFRDRTNEFRAAVESAARYASSSAAAAPSSSSGGGVGGPLDVSRGAASAHSEFNRRASKIGLGIHQTSQKLARLAKRMPPPSSSPRLPSLRCWDLEPRAL
jgi:syntaxin 5